MFPFVWILFILSVFMARTLSTYRENGYFKSYITVKNKLAGKLLAGKPKLNKEKSFDGYRIRIVGITFYCWCVVALAVSLLVMTLPEVKGELINLRRLAIITDSLNLTYTVGSFLTLLFAEVLFEDFEIDRITNSQNKLFKAVNVFLHIFLLISVILMMIFSSIDLITIIKSI